MYVTKHIDWLSITFAPDEDIPRIFPLLDWNYIGRGMHGYKFKYQDRITGARFQSGSASEEMGVHLTLDGEALNSLRSTFGGVDDGLVKTLADRHGYASRIDLTLNIHEGQLTPRKVFNAFKAGTLKARASKGRFVEGIDGNVSGDTFYLGSPKSDRQFRAYNKGAELRIVDGAAWLRLELELRNLSAQGAFGSCKDNGVAETVSGHMDDFITWNNDEYRTAIGGPSAQPYELPRKPSNRQRWLLGQVAQALANEITLDPAFRDTFNQSVDNYLDKR